MNASRQAVSPRAVLLMVLLCSVWGLTHVVARLTSENVSLVMQGGLRSLIASVLVIAWARYRNINLFSADGTLGPGLFAGILFAGEFLFIFAGLAHTTASRMVVFVYLSPVLTALGLHAFVPGEQLHRTQWVGVVLAFVGIVAAFGEGFVKSRASLLGDTFGIAAAILWAATTVWIRASRLSRMSPEKVLFYQLAVCSAAMLIASPLLGESGIVHFGVQALASLLFQGVVVAFASYLAWFWLLTRYRAANLSAFGFLTPMFGVVFSVVILGEPLSTAFLVSVILVGVGITLVNRR